jgi:hypothetical protein
MPAHGDGAACPGAGVRNPAQGPTLARLIDHLVGSRMIQELAPRRPGSVAVAAILKDVLFWVLAAN